LRFRIFGDPREQAAQLDGSRRLAFLIDGGWECGDLRTKVQDREALRLARALSKADMQPPVRKSGPPQ